MMGILLKTYSRRKGAYVRLDNSASTAWTK